MIAGVSNMISQFMKLAGNFHTWFIGIKISGAFHNSPFVCRALPSRILNHPLMGDKPEITQNRVTATKVPSFQCFP
jgi:hypothetical protein